MIYVYWYLGIGAVVIIAMLAFNELTQRKDYNSLSNLLADLRAGRKSLLKDVLGPALIGTLFVPFWPALVVVKVKYLISARHARDSIDEPAFAVTREDLQTQLSLQEIEQLEMVIDPMGAAPNVPFGHLNKAWKNFCEGMKPNDCLWSFTAHRTSAWGRKNIRQGYVIVRGKKIGAHFMTVWKDIEEDTGQETGSGK